MTQNETKYVSQISRGGPGLTTERTCNEHAPAKVSWDYTKQGDCPCCPGEPSVDMLQLEDDLESAHTLNGSLEDDIRSLGRRLDNANDTILKLDKEINDQRGLLDLAQKESGSAATREKRQKDMVNELQDQLANLEAIF